MVHKFKITESNLGETFDILTMAEDPNGNRNEVSDQEQNKLKTSNTLVVVRKSLPKEPLNLNLDPLYIRINEIAFFNPIIDHAKKFPWSKSTGSIVSSSINSKPLIKVGKLYNGYLRRNTEILVRDQNVINTKIKQVDFELGKMMKVFTTRQKQYAHIANKFGQIPEIYRRLSKAQSSLHDLVNFVELLEGILDDLNGHTETRGSFAKMMSDDDQVDMIGLVPSKTQQN